MSHNYYPICMYCGCNATTENGKTTCTNCGKEWER